MQLFYNLSDPATEDALYEIESMRNFVGLRLSEPLPDETTIFNFRHLLEKHKLGKVILKQINKHLGKAGLLLKGASEQVVTGCLEREIRPARRCISLLNPIRPDLFRGSLAPDALESPALDHFTQ